MTAPRDEIPAEILAFLHSCIDSVEQLQVLLLLQERRAHAQPIEDLSRELRSSEASVRKRVRDLVERQVLASDAMEQDQVRFRPASAQVEILVMALAECFRQRPHRVIAQIFARPPASIQSFSDAFQFRKDEDE